MPPATNLTTLPAQIANAEVFRTLRSTFGYTSFRPLQYDIVRSILDARDVFVLMPTGGGKSLCYQLPALLLNGLTVVISPLIALMKDQVDALQAAGVAATFINSSLDAGDIRARQAAVARGDITLLYVAPERLYTPGFARLLDAVQPRFFAIDEAHCISEWGHDFRPEYRQLQRLREQFPHAVIGAFTATATPRVQADIKQQLGLHNAASFQGSFNRHNLFYDVRPKQNAYDQIFAYLSERRDQSGIIYCATRATADQLAERLRADGLNVVAYHAGLDSQERQRRQDAFVDDDVQVIVATIAFGMGIDKPDVRFVIHYDLPKNLEGFYQESGRAGRDGEPAECIVLYSYGDVAKQQHFIAQKSSDRERRIAEQQLRLIADWAGTIACRRRSLLTYFEEEYDGSTNPCCDVCRDPVEEVDYTVPAQMFLSCVKRTGERFGTAHVIEVLRGSRSQRVLQWRHDQLSTWGIGKDRSKEEWQHLARQLLLGGYASQDAERYHAVVITDKGYQVLFKGARVLIAAPPVVTPRANPASQTSAANLELFERLRRVRKRLADERGMPPYVVFHDTALRIMTADLPTSREALLRIPGVGERKAEEFGDAFLTEIAIFKRENGSPRPKPAGLSATVRATLELFHQGENLSDIAVARGMTRDTVESHLVEALEHGEMLDLDRVVDAAKQPAIRAAFAAVGSTPLKPVMERLGAGYSYGELRLIRAADGRRPVNGS